jgi:succinate dehydrogenase / fumarate reductase cytochrome b subunit
MSGIPSPVHAPRWFDLRARQVGSWAFILNRLSALGLTFYLGLHLIVLDKLAHGAKAYNDFVAFSQTPLIKVGEVVLMAAVVFHGINGLRLTLHALSIGIRQQKKLLAIAVTVTILVSTLRTKTAILLGRLFSFMCITSLQRLECRFHSGNCRGDDLFIMDDRNESSFEL